MEATKNKGESDRSVQEQHFINVHSIVYNPSSVSYVAIRNSIYQLQLRSLGVSKPEISCRDLLKRIEKKNSGHLQLGIKIWIIVSIRNAFLSNITSLFPSRNPCKSLIVDIVLDTLFNCFIFAERKKSDKSEFFQVRLYFSAKLLTN